MLRKIAPIPEGYSTVTPSFTFKDSKKAIEFYKIAFGAKLVDIFPSPSGHGIMHATIQIGNSMMMRGDENPGMNCKSAETLGASPISLFVYVPDADRQQHAQINRRHRISDRRSSSRSRHRVGLPDGRHGGLAEDESRRKAGRLWDARRRRIVETLRLRISTLAEFSHGKTPVDERGQRRSGRRVSRHNVGRYLGEPR